MTRTINEVVWDNIRDERKKQKITQKQLWEKTGLSRTWLSLIETWDKSPTIRTLEIIANVLEVDIKELFNK